MGRKTATEKAGARASWRALARYVVFTLGSLALAAGAFAGYSRVRQFLVSSEEFRLAGPGTYEDEASTIRIEGTVHCRRESVVRIFAADFDRSVYLIPLAERRRSLLAIDWVKDATVSRLWPNRVVVRITERTPVAFVQIPAPGAAGTFEAGLIDEDGVILDPPETGRFTLPVFTGIRREQSAGMRRQRVRAALRLGRELGGMIAKISEIDAGDPQNLRVTLPVDGRAVVLFLGNENFLARLRSFLDHYPEIQRRLAQATVFDLRLDDRITVVKEEQAGG